MKKIIIVLFLLSGFAVIPLMRSGFFNIHDFQHAVRLFELDKSLRSGQFPVRWVEGLGFGLGYPLFNFYPPLVYYFGEIIHLLGFGFLDSIKIIWAVALLGSGAAMYFLSKEFFGKWGGLVCALLYLYAPYHAVDAYVRGALAELFSFVWLPLILLASYKVFKVDKVYKVRWSLITGLLLGLLMITHNLIFLPFFGFVVLWYFGISFSDRQNLIRNTLYFILYTVIAFGLTAFFWLPALWEKQFTLVDQLLTRDLASYKIHFICLGQLWNSPWGFGGSIAGCVDGFSFKIGKLHVILSVLALGVALYLWRRNKKLSLIILSSLFFLIFSIFMATQYSQFIWDRVPQLWYLQFPWRFLEFVVLFSSFLAGAVFLFLDNKPKLQAILGTLLVAATLFLNVKYFQPQYYSSQASDNTLLTDTEIRWNVSKTSFEYLPKGIVVQRNDKGEPLPVKISDEKKVATAKYTADKNILISSSTFAPDRFILEASASGSGNMQFNIADFPGWSIFIDGKQQSINDQNDLKLITITIPSGQHVIIGKFENTPSRVIGNSISVASVILLIGLFFYARRKSRT